MKRAIAISLAVIGGITYAVAAHDYVLLQAVAAGLGVLSLVVLLAAAAEPSAALLVADTIEAVAGWAVRLLRRQATARTAGKAAYSKAWAEGK